jgi:hypothetical protein
MASSGAVQLSYFDPAQRSFQLAQGAGFSIGGNALLLQESLGALASFLGMLDIDLLGSFGVIRQHGDHIIVDLQKAAGDKKSIIDPSSADSHLSEIQRRQEGSMPRQYAKLALAPRSDDHLGLTLEDGLLRGDNDHMQRWTLCHTWPPLHRYSLCSYDRYD